MFATRTTTMTTSTSGSTTRSVVRRGAAPLAALALAASGLAVSPAQAAEPWIGLEAFAPEPMTVAKVPGAKFLDNTNFAAVAPGLPQPSIAAFTIIGKVADTLPKGASPASATAWKIGTYWVYKTSDTRLRLDRTTARVKVLASRLTTAGAQALVADRVLKKSGTSATTEVEIAYLFTGAVSDPGASIWTVTEGTSSVQVDVSGAATGEPVVDPELDGLAAGGRATVEMVPPGTDLG